MMKLKSAREAWSAAYYQPWDSISSVMAEQAALGMVEAGGFIVRKIEEVDDQGRPFSWKQRIYCPAIKQDRGGRPNTAGKAADQALAGYIQRAIGTLSPSIRAFGHHMYSPIATLDDMETAEALVWEWFEARRIYQGIRMTAAKREKAAYVARLCLHRYRRLHQGGMSEGIDPAPTPESFRMALDDVYGIHLESAAWAREWQPVIDMIMEVCSAIDKRALMPVASIVGELKAAA